MKGKKGEKGEKGEKVEGVEGGEVAGEERAFLLEHRPVITYGRRPGVERNVLAGAAALADA